MNDHDTLVTHLAKTLETELNTLGQNKFARQRLDQDITDLDAIAHAPPTSPPVRADIVRTHISSIILLGDYAFKLKRPVQLPFLDYSRLPLRHEACLQEWQINQRTAPEIYLGVRAILGTASEPKLATRSHIASTTRAMAIDWLVVMRRFKAECLFSELARRGNLQKEHITQLAAHIANFHAQCPPLTPTDVQHDAPTQQWLMSSLQEISAQLSDPEAQTQIATLELGCMAHDLVIQALQARRLMEGKVRDCHGDMHLENITVFNEQVMAFDAIDFNAALRRIDVINEVAFVVMDLMAHSLPKHAWSLLNHYLQLTGDYTGLPLLEYYVRYRAIVRAKVALLNHTDSAVFQRYWLLACKLRLTNRSTQCILISGLSGSGKSTIARELSQSLGAIWLRADVERKRLFPEFDNRYHTDTSRIIYQHLLNTAKSILQAGYHVIIDATFQDQSNLDHLIAGIQTIPPQDSSVQLHAILCQAPPHILEQRIHQRSFDPSEPSEATAEVLRAQINRQNQRPTQWSIPLSTICNDSSLEDLQTKTELWLKQYPLEPMH